MALEIDPHRVTDAALGTDLSLYTRRVQTFTGPTVKKLEVFVHIGVVNVMV
jgi:hypothetical protein